VSKKTPNLKPTKNQSKTTRKTIKIKCQNANFGQDYDEIEKIYELKNRGALF